MSEIVSPPFPASPLMMPLQLWHLCRDFEAWLRAESVAVHGETGRDCCTKIRELPRTEPFLNLGFLQHCCIWMELRRLRETFDRIVRNHDDDWDSKNALRLRHMLVKRGILVLEYAFLPREVLEARMEKVNSAYIKKQEHQFEDMFDLLMGKKEPLHEHEKEEGGDDVGGADEDYDPEAT